MLSRLAVAGSPPRPGDFDDLTLEPQDLAAVQKDPPGDCALRLGDRGIARFQTEVDWVAPDAGRLANRPARQMLLAYAEAYLWGGDVELGAVHNEREPRLVAEVFQTLVWKATNLYQLAYPFATYLEKYPNAELPGAEEPDHEVRASERIGYRLRASDFGPSRCGGVTSRQPGAWSPEPGA